MNHDNMKMTEIGWIPKDWECKRLDGCSLIKARIGWQGLTKSEYLPYGTYYLVGGTDFENGRVNWNTCSFVTKERFEQDKYIQIRNHDVLISKDGTIGKVAYVNDFDGHGTLNSGVFVVRPKSKDIDQGYFAWTFLSMYFDDFISRLTAGSTIKHLYQKDLVNFLFPLPTKLSEQRRIAEVLSDTDSLIASLSRTIEKKRLVKQGAMQQLLTGKTRLKGFCEEWVEMELREVCQITMGQSPDSRYYNTSKQGLPLIQGNADIEKRKSIDRIYTTQITKTCDTGDIIMSVRAPVGAVGIATRTSCIGRGACAMKCRNRFVYQWLMYQEDKWSSLSTGSTFDSINSDTLNKVRLMIPIDENEQIAIANLLTTMDDEIAALEAERDKYISIKQGMMQKLLTGEIRLPICQTTE